MRKFIFEVKLQGKSGNFTKNDLLYRFVYGIILLKTLIN